MFVLNSPYRTLLCFSKYILFLLHLWYNSKNFKGENAMSNLTTELLTRENITLALSIFGSIGTLVTFISSYLSKRKNLRIKCKNQRKKIVKCLKLS